MRYWMIDLRRSKQLTQVAVAEMAEISRAYYAQLETNQRNPSIKVAKKLAVVLDIEWTRFYESGLQDSV